MPKHKGKQCVIVFDNIILITLALLLLFSVCEIVKKMLQTGPQIILARVPHVC